MTAVAAPRAQFDCNDLRFLIAVAESGSTVAAARRLHVNQSTVARRITALEQAVGVALFERASAGYSLTPRGCETASLARHVKKAADSREATARSRRRETSGLVHVTTTELLASEIIAPLVARLRTDAPGTKFELATGDRRLDLRSGEADLAIRLVEPTPEPDLVGRRVGTSRWASYCSRDYAERSGLPSMTEDLGSHRLIAGSGALENSAAHLWFRNIAGKAEIAMRCNTVANLSAAVRSGNGIGP